MLVQPGVIQAAPVPNQGGALRRQACLLIELFDQQVLRCGGRCLAPTQQLRTAGLIQQLHVAQRLLRRGTHLFQQRQQVMGQTFDSAGFEQLRGIVEGQAQAARWSSSLCNCKSNLASRLCHASSSANSLAGAAG